MDIKTTRLYPESQKQKYKIKTVFTDSHHAKYSYEYALQIENKDFFSTMQHIIFRWILTGTSYMYVNSTNALLYMFLKSKYKTSVSVLQE